MIKLSTKFLPPHLKQFTKKRTFFLSIGENRVIRPISYWDGGSRDEWAVFQRVCGCWVRMAINVQTVPPQFGGEQTIEKLHKDKVVAQFGTFCGKPAMLKIHCANVADVLNPTVLNDPNFVEEIMDEPNLIAQLRAAKYDS